MNQCPDYLEENMDDEYVEEEFDGYTILTDIEFVEWCQMTQEDEPYGDC